jgi:signal peptidase I
MLVETMSKPSIHAKWSKAWWVENTLSLGFALLVVFAVRSTIIEAFKIPSGSMIPTLLIGDHIFVNKFAYGVKIPFTDWLMDTPVTVIEREPPKAGDIVVFVFPRDESVFYIKRVVGVPGDKIEIRNKVLYINDKPVDRKPLEPKEAETILSDLDDARYSRQTLELFDETLGGHPHRVMLDKNVFLGESFEPIIVPKDSLFVMGDNRDFSNDSRFWGFVPMKNVRGKALVIWLSAWINFSDRSFTFRPERTGTVLK